MGYLVDGYKIMGNEIKTYAVNNKAQIASAISIFGTVVSNILSTRAGAKSARLIDAKEAEIGRRLNTKEKVELCWKNHVASGAVMVGSVASGVYSNNTHVKNFNAAATAYGAIKKLYDSSKKATREVLGEKKAQELDAKLAQKTVDENPEIKQKIISTPNPDPSTMRKFYEPVFGEVIVTTVDKLELALKTINAEMDALKPRSKVNGNGLNSVHGVKLVRLYDLLDQDIPQTKRMSEVFRYYGWNKGAEADGRDDEHAVAYYSPILLDDDTMEAAAQIDWTPAPSDMRMGNFIKL